MNTYIVCSIIFAICAIAIAVSVLVVNHNKTYKTAGTLHIDLSKDAKEICLLALDLPLVELVNEKVVYLKIDDKAKLRSWAD